MILYQNYHRHSNYSVITSGGDSVVKNEEYAKRAVELEHKIISGVEHGFAGRHVEPYELAKQYDLKFLFGAEAYWVKDRFEKDRTNAHIVVMAKNEIGRKALNVALSEAFTSGYYYVPRLDLSLLFSLPKNDVWVTSACIGGWKYEDADNLWLSMAKYFGDNFFFEVQNHNTDSQKQLNKRIIDLSAKHGIKTIFGCDSHFIFPNQASDREAYLASKGIFHEEELGWYMDYPDGDTVVQRFAEQGVLTESQYMEAINNTNILLQVEPYDSPVYTKQIKMPTLYPNNTKEEKDVIYENLVWKMWDEEKKKIDPAKWSLYESEIQKEISVVKNISHADYFLLDYEIVKRAKEKGGIITSTGRGSGVGFYTCKLLGLTKIDRIASPVRLYQERFLSETRILETGSLADLDLNLANPEVFADAQKEILGDDYSYPMIAWGTMRDKEAWKMYARSNNVPFEVANVVSSQIEEYETAKKYADEDEEINIREYIARDHIEMVIESQKYLGIYSNVKIHPCAHLVAPFNIRKEAGLIAMRTANGTVNVCTLVDGLWAEKHGMLKNDLLKVSVVDLYARVYKRIGMNDTHDVNELWEITKNDESVWRIYSEGIVMGVNQVEQDATLRKVKKYKPSNISELSAFVAAVRPGFKSMYPTFESREPFKYDVEDFDKLIQTEEMPNSFVLYQEHSMATLAYAGIPIANTYEIVKSIAKKRYSEVVKYKEQFIAGFSEKLLHNKGVSEGDAFQIANRVWQILEDSSQYSFNSAHALSVATDSLYTAYLKAHYPIYYYEQLLQILEEKGEKERIMKTRHEAETFFKIKFPSLKFGQDNTKIVARPETNEITVSMSTLKGFGNDFAEELLKLSREFSGENLVDLFIYAKDNGYFSPSKWEKLIQINYFSEFGYGWKVLEFFKEFTSGKNRYNPDHKEKTKIERIKNLREIWNTIPNRDFSNVQKIMNEIAVAGEIHSRFPGLDDYLFIVDVYDEGKYSPRITVHSLESGRQFLVKVSKRNYVKLHSGNFVRISSLERKPSVRKTLDGFEEIPDEYTDWMNTYRIVKDIEEIG